MNNNKGRRGFIDVVLAAILAAGSIFLPAVQHVKSFTQSAGPATPVVNTGR